MSLPWTSPHRWAYHHLHSTIGAASIYIYDLTFLSGHTVRCICEAKLFTPNWNLLKQKETK